MQIFFREDLADVLSDMAWRENGGPNNRPNGFCRKRWSRLPRRSNLNQTSWWEQESSIRRVKCLTPEWAACAVSTDGGGSLRDYETAQV